MSDYKLEHDLVAQAADGDRLALGKLLLGHYEPLRRHVGPLLPTSLECLVSVDDLIQQTFAAAFKGIRTLQNRTAAGFSRWLEVIADNQLRNTLEALRAQKRGGNVRPAGLAAKGQASSLVNLASFLSDYAETPQGDAARHEAAQAIDAGLDALPSTQRRAVRLYHFEGKSVEQTAAALKRSPGAVRGLLQRARQGLRDALGRSSRWFSRK
jgi:RNA polymerase sigma-70 factor (ECF subfamily)